MSENSNEEKPSAFKQAFQWAAAVVAPLGCESPAYAYNLAGASWDYVKTWYGSKKGPQLT